MLKSVSADVLVIGAGVAGLEAAFAACGAGKSVLVISKGASASPGILGFCAPVDKNDSVSLFEKDIYQGGWELGHPALVHTLASCSADTVTQLETLGFAFDHKPENPDEYALLQPLGCSVPRLVKHGNKTGRDSMVLLREKLELDGVRFLEPAMALELLKQDGAVCGAVCVDLQTKEAFIVAAGAVVLSCGGAHLMKNSTYPLCQTADGFAMAWHAGAALVDMEFVQHEPCRAVWPKPLGLSTTLLAKGGILTNNRGERYLLKHYPSEGAVPKDMLARLNAMEIREGRGSEHGGVYLDLTGLPQEEITEKHVLYYERFLGAGIDLTKDVVEVGPAAHSMMGGVSIQADCSTGVPGLFAAGEVTGGLHGANRLGGNAGAEVYVFGRIAGASAAKTCASVSLTEQTVLDAETIVHAKESASGEDYEACCAECREIMASAMGPIRDVQGLTYAIARLEMLQKRLTAAVPSNMEDVIERLEALHLAETGTLVCKAGLMRTESRGVHYRLDYPEKDDLHWKTSIRITLKDGFKTEKGGNI